MEPEYGRVYSVETRWAGANVDGDHPAGSTTLNVLLGWDFDEDGGQCEVTPESSLPVALFRKWSGDSRGGGDDRFDQQSATVTEDSGGDRPPRLKVDTSGNNGFVAWGGLGVTAEHAASVPVILPAYPGAKVPVMVPRSSEAAKAGQLNIQGSG